MTDTPPAGDVPQDGFEAPKNLIPGPQYEIPDATPEQFVCLRGPCRHYWHLVTDAHVGNPAGSFEAMGLEVPKLHHHTCLLNPGQETEFAEDCAYDCSRWDPFSPRELKKIEKRRNAYFKRNNRIFLKEF